MSKVLYIDDHQDTLEMVREVARQIGIDITICSNGGEALTLLNAETFDAVILDLSMPVLDGLTIAEEIRNNEALNPHKKPVSIVFYTARQIDAAVQRIGNRVKVRAIYPKSADTDIYEMLVEVRQMCEEKHQMVIKGNQRGAASTNWLIVLLALFLQAASITIFLWLNHQTQESWAIKWAEMKSQRDSMKIICDSNAEKKNALEIVIGQNQFTATPELLTERPCVVNLGEQ